MKGLFIKDLKLLRNQKKLLFIAVAMFVFFMFTMEDELFVINYLTFFGSVIAIGTLSYDELNNGMAFMFTLPVSRRQYVLEKYLFCFLMSLAVWAVSLGLNCAFMYYRGLLVNPGEFLLESVTGLILASFMISMILPLQIKLGQEKSRTGLFIVAGVVVIAFTALKLFIAPTDEEMNTLLSGFSGMSLATVMIGLGAIAIILLVASYLITVAIIKRKEY